MDAPINPTSKPYFSEYSIGRIIITGKVGIAKEKAGNA